MSKLFSETLKALRGNRKKAEFARLLGLSAPVYQRYEDGRMPRADVLSDIAKRLQITVEQLLGGEVNCPTQEIVSPATAVCRYPEGCDLEAQLGMIRERLAEVGKLESRLAAMEGQLDTVIRLLGASLHLPQPAADPASPARKSG